MLNIKDIEKRNHKEPQEVTAIRENILKSFSRLEFQEGPHKYFIHNDDKTILEVPSVSAITHEFEPKVDWDVKTIEYALKHNRTVESVKREWEENNVRATNNGTSTHLFGEAYMYFFMGKPELIPDVIKPQYEKGYLIPYSEKQDAIANFYENLFTNDDIYPVMPEAQVYMGINDEYANIRQYAGTFDMLFTYKKDNEWQLALYDWKTNKSLENDFNRLLNEVVNNPSDIRHKKWLNQYGENAGCALSPFNKMYNESLTYYTLQLSCYSLCLQQLGYKIADRTIVWLKKDIEGNGQWETINLDDVTEELKQALQK